MTIVERIIMMLIMNVAKAYCGLWYFLRCRLLRRNLDLDYHIFTFDMPEGNDVPFFAKVVESNSAYEKTSAVKIGNVCIRYTIEKLVRLSDVAELNSTEPEIIIRHTLINYLNKQAHHNPSIIQTKTKDNNDDWRKQVNLKY
jgi:hypothetical protein